MDVATTGVPAATASAPVDGPAGPGAARHRLSIVVSSVASDSHTWNLVFLRLSLEELGHTVHSLGACVPDDLLVDECRRVRPDLVVISTVNGHGYHDGTRLIRRLRACAELATTPVVIGGKLGIAGPSEGACRDELRSAGFDAVFQEEGSMGAFRAFVEALSVGVGP